MIILLRVVGLAAVLGLVSGCRGPTPSAEFLAAEEVDWRNVKPGQLQSFPLHGQIWKLKETTHALPHLMEVFTAGNENVRITLRFVESTGELAFRTRQQRFGDSRWQDHGEMTIWYSHGTRLESSYSLGKQCGISRAFRANDTLELERHPIGGLELQINYSEDGYRELEVWSSADREIAFREFDATGAVIETKGKPPFEWDPPAESKN